MYPGTYAEFLWHKEHPQEQARSSEAGRAGGVGRGQAGQPHQGRQTTRRSEAAHAGEKRSAGASPDKPTDRSRPQSQPVAPLPSRDERKRTDAEARKRQRAVQARRSQIEVLESQIATVEQAIREIEQTMAAPGFYDDRTASQPIIDRHQNLMWKVGDLMHQWEELQNADLTPTSDSR